MFVRVPNLPVKIFDPSLFIIDLRALLCALIIYLFINIRPPLSPYFQSFPKIRCPYFCPNSFGSDLFLGIC